MSFSIVQDLSTNLFRKHMFYVRNVASKKPLYTVCVMTLFCGCIIVGRMMGSRIMENYARAALPSWITLWGICTHRRNWGGTSDIQDDLTPSNSKQGTGENWCDNEVLLLKLSILGLSWDQGCNLHKKHWLGVVTPPRKQTDKTMSCQCQWGHSTRQVVVLTRGNTSDFPLKEWLWDVLHPDWRDL